MISYDKCSELQREAVEALKDRQAPDSVRIAIELLGVILPCLPEVEKIIGAPLNEPDKIRAAIEARKLTAQRLAMVLHAELDADGWGTIDPWCIKQVAERDNEDPDPEEIIVRGLREVFQRAADKLNALAEAGATTVNT